MAATLKGTIDCAFGVLGLTVRKRSAQSGIGQADTEVPPSGGTNAETARNDAQVMPRGVELSVDEAQAITLTGDTAEFTGGHTDAPYRYARGGYYGAGTSHWDCVGYFGPGCCGFPGHCPRGYYGSYWRY